MKRHIIYRSRRLSAFLADTSYAVYLFHWPFYIIFSQLTSNLLAVLLTLICSYGFASLSFYVLEPWIAGKNTPIVQTLRPLPYIHAILQQVQES